MQKVLYSSSLSISPYSSLFLHFTTLTFCLVPSFFIFCSFPSSFSFPFFPSRSVAPLSISTYPLSSPTFSLAVHPSLLTYSCHSFSFALLSCSFSFLPPFRLPVSSARPFSPTLPFSSLPPFILILPFPFLPFFSLSIPSLPSYASLPFSSLSSPFPSLPPSILFPNHPCLLLPYCPPTIPLLPYYPLTIPLLPNCPLTIPLLPYYPLTIPLLSLPCHLPFLHFSSFLSSLNFPIFSFRFFPTSTLFILLVHFRIKLLIPEAEQRRGHIQSFSVQTALYHLRCSFHLLPFQVGGLWLLVQLGIFYNLHWAPFENTSPNKYLRYKE